MDRFFEFVLTHWILSGLFIILLILLFIEEARAKGVGGLGITPDKLTHLMNKENAAVLDIRAVDAYNDSHIINAINIPLESVTSNIKKIEKYKNTTLVIVDVNGNKSVAIANKLKKEGFTKIHVLMGGFNAWKNAKLPTVKKDTKQKSGKLKKIKNEKIKKVK